MTFLLVFLTALIIAGLTHSKIRFILILLALLSLALFRYTQAVLPPSGFSVQDAVGQATRVSGIVSSEVERRVSMQRVVLDDVEIADSVAQGKLLVWIPLYPQVSYGDTLVFNCRLEIPEPFEGFAYDRFLASRGILAECSRPQYVDVQSASSVSIVGSILSFKEKTIHRLRSLVPEPHASFLAGLLFGGSSALSNDLRDDFSVTGTSHILAASGFNVSLFSLIFLGWILKTRIGRRRSLILASVLLVAYVITAGATPAVVRAGIMGGLVVLERWISRKAFMLNALLLTAALMLLVNPLILLDDVGFQLSFVATAAVLTLTKPLSVRLAFIPDLFSIRESFSASIAAIVITLPIVLFYFGQISLVAPIVNLLVLPLVPFAMALTVLTLVAGLVSSTVALPFTIFSWALSTVMLWVVSIFGAMDLAFIEPAHSEILAVLAIGFATVFVLKLKGYEH